MNENLLQYALIGNLFGGESRRLTKEAIEKSGFKPEYVTDPVLRTAYDMLMSATSDDRTLLMSEAQNKLGGETLNKCAENASADPADYERVVLKLKDAGIAAKVDKIYNEVKCQNATGEFKIADLARRFGNLSRSILAQAESGGVSLSEFSDPTPEDQDPDCLLRGRFLTKGVGLVIVSVSGSGKSAIILQFAYAWALGRPAFGIQPIRPLKIGLFETEDDKEEMAEFRASIRQGYMKFYNWTDDDLAKAEKNVTVYRPDEIKGRRGKEFLSYLNLEQRKNHFDLIILNPYTGITGFDILDNAKSGDFLREDIDSIIRHDDETKCGLVIVHHTNKPPSQQQNAGFGTDQYAQYIGSDAAALTNWMRSMLTIIPASEKGQYYLVAAKKGERLGWPELPGKKNHKPMRLIRHSTPDEGIIFWREVTTLEAESATAKEKPCVTKDAAILAGDLKECARTLTDARNHAKSRFGHKRGNAAYNELIGHLSDHELVIEPTKISTQKVIGTKEGVKNAISTIQEKHRQDEAAKFGKTANE